MNPESHSTEAAAVADLTMQACRGYIHGEETPTVPVFTRGQNTKSSCLEHLLDHPTRIRAHAKLLTLADFAAYVLLQRPTDANTLIFADDKSRLFKAFLDYHGQEDGDARWLDNTAEFTLLHSNTFLAWWKVCGRPMRQDAFADFLENQSPDILPGQGADMHSIAANFSALKVKTFRNARTKENGDFEITHSEESKGDQTTTVPPEFNIAIPIWKGDNELTPITIKLRWRLGDEGVNFTMEMKLIDRLLEKEWTNQLAILGELIAGKARVLQGDAPSAPVPLSVSL